MGLRPTKGDEDAVAYALVRAVFALLRTQSAQKERRSHKCERGTLRSVRHDGAQSLQRSVPTGFVVALPCGRGSVASKPRL
jgi:hypothetical protein